MLSTRPVVGLRFRSSDLLRIACSSADDIHMYTGWECEHVLSPLAQRLSLEERSGLCGKSHQILKSNIVSGVSAFKKTRNQFWNFPKVFLLGAHGNQPKLIQNNDFCRVRAFL